MSPLAGRTVWVSGAGSGMGRAAAVAAARLGARVVVSGRRVEALEGTAALVRDAGGTVVVEPFDVADPDALAGAHARIGPVTDLVLSAGRNAKRRAWADQELAEFRAIVDVNLTGVVAMIDATLPDLRAARGQVVVISSVAGWRFSATAGVAYGASKTALASVCQTLNAQEAATGVRACHLCPGDVATDFLELRPTVPDAAARARMLTPDDVAAAVSFVLQSPPHVRIDELVITPAG